MLLVGEPERGSLEGDLRLEFEASAAAVAPAEVLELVLGGHATGLFDLGGELQWAREDVGPQTRWTVCPLVVAVGAPRASRSSSAGIAG